MPSWVDTVIQSLSTLNIVMLHSEFKFKPDQPTIEIKLKSVMKESLLVESLKKSFIDVLIENNVLQDTLTPSTEMTIWVILTLTIDTIPDHLLRVLILTLTISIRLRRDLSTRPSHKLSITRVTLTHLKDISTII